MVVIAVAVRGTMINQFSFLSPAEVQVFISASSLLIKASTVQQDAFHCFGFDKGLCRAVCAGHGDIMLVWFSLFFLQDGGIC